MQAGDVPDTYADVTNLEQAVAYRPDTTVEAGIQAFLQWYLEYFVQKEAA